MPMPKVPTEPIRAPSPAPTAPVPEKVVEKEDQLIVTPPSAKPLRAPLGPVAPPMTSVVNGKTKRIIFQKPETPDKGS
jgi:hypothetical protein